MDISAWRQRVTVKPADKPDVNPKTLRANRLVVPFINHENNREIVILLGKSWVSVLGLTCAVLKSLESYGSLAKDEALQNVLKNWRETISIQDKFCWKLINMPVPEQGKKAAPVKIEPATKLSADTTHIEDNWIGVYVNGSLEYTNLYWPELDMIERVSRGREISPNLLIEHKDEFILENKLMEVDVESIASLRFNISGKHVRCSLLDRNIVAGSAFSFTIPFDTGGVRSQIVLKAATLCWWLIEAASLARSYKLISKRSHDYRVYGIQREVAEKLSDIRERIIDIDRAVEVAENKDNVHFRPQRPLFFI